MVGYGEGVVGNVVVGAWAGIGNGDGSGWNVVVLEFRQWDDDGVELGHWRTDVGGDLGAGGGVACQGEQVEE